MTVNQKQLYEMFQHYQPVFDALSNPLRQQIMFTLAESAENGSTLSVQQLAERLSCARPTVSHHIKILLNAQLVEPSKTGTQVFYQPRFETPLAMARSFTAALEIMTQTKGGK